MCGILGFIATNPSHLPSLDHAHNLRAHIHRRGPDDQGHHHTRDNRALLLHTRLAILDTSAAGHQPMLADDQGNTIPHDAPPETQRAARYTLLYNGELYNEQPIRNHLEAQGRRFHSRTDTETVLQALIHNTPKACLSQSHPHRFRGMFALALYDAHKHTLLLARDPLGVKPLYLAQTPKGLAFASEPPPILESGWLTPKPNLQMVSAYITTIRTVIDKHTMFQGLEALPPATAATFTFNNNAQPARTDTRYWQGPSPDHTQSEDDATRTIRDALTDAVQTHMRADVPVCALLSGGLDSSITTALALAHHPKLQTFASGARPDPPDQPNDLTYARQVADFLGTTHAEAPLTQDTFLDRWQHNVNTLGTPMMTPNEAAIQTVAQALRDAGCTVTISGEGADELFGGYAGPMTSATVYARNTIRHPAQPNGLPHPHPGEFELENVAWVGQELKQHILNTHTLAKLDNDAFLKDLYRTQFDRVAAEVHPNPNDPVGTQLAAHLKFQRAINLTGLLQRLDTATMLASVEGRTPFADAELATAAERTPLHLRFNHHAIPQHPAPPEAEPQHTKAVLRKAFAADIPPVVLTRPKASFPLPFQRWAAPLAPIAAQSDFLKQHCTEAAIATVAAQPQDAWNIAWPLINLALWAQRWWDR